MKDGAEDYIVKPFEMLEVMVRLEKVLERNGTVQEQIQIGDVIIDTASRTVTKLGMEIYLKPMEYNCLMVFAKNPNKALTRNQILQELWNEEFCGETRTVDAHVGRIRKKLGWQDKILACGTSWFPVLPHYIPPCPLLWVLQFFFLPSAFLWGLVGLSWPFWDSLRSGSFISGRGMSST